MDTGFPIGNATNIESRALSGYDLCNFRVNLIGKRSRSCKRDPAVRLCERTRLPETTTHAVTATIAVAVLQYCFIGVGLALEGILVPPA